MAPCCKAERSHRANGESAIHVGARHVAPEVVSVRWDKCNGANFANANKQPLKTHESVLVFATGQTTYNPQKVSGAKNHVQGKNANLNVSETRLINKRVNDDLSGMKFPK